MVLIECATAMTYEFIREKDPCCGLTDLVIVTTVYAYIDSSADLDGRSPARAHVYVEPRADASGVPTDRGGAADGRGDVGQGADAVVNYDFISHQRRWC
jgi:hypothetical protein